MNLYAWTSHNSVLFTTSLTPAVGDTLKNSSGVSQDWEITSISQDYSYITAIGDIAEWRFDRDSTQDILESSGSQVLTDGNGNVYVLNGQVLVTDSTGN